MLQLDFSLTHVSSALHDELENVSVEKAALLLKPGILLHTVLKISRCLLL